MIISTGNKLDIKTPLIILLDAKNKCESVPKVYQELLQQFQKSKETFEYYKLEKGFVAFIKYDKDAEKTRVFGHKLRGLLAKSEKAVQIIGQQEQVLWLAEGLALSAYQFLKYFKDAKEKQYALNKILLFGVDQKKISELNNLISAVYWSRDLVNEPVSYLTATQLAKEIEVKAKGTGISVKTLEKAQISSLKMGGILAVNKGSIEPPTFTIMEYKPKKAKNKKPIVLVGKGVVYDTGGLSLKPTAGSMDLMKSDMAGAACMAGVMYAAAMNKLDLHLIALIPATDNRPGLDAYAPGDVITMFDGTTVEVLNTDAEGRMILADALSYSNKLNAELVIDAATLTGAAVAAIGTKASCLMGNASKKTMEALVEAGYTVHERLALLPFWDDYLEEMKSSIADLKNIGGRYAGMITAGKFLEHFVTAPYVHLDIAGPSFLSTEENYKGKGGTGSGVRLLHEFLKHYK